MQTSFNSSLQKSDRKDQHCKSATHRSKPQKAAPANTIGPQRPIKRKLTRLKKRELM